MAHVVPNGVQIRWIWQESATDFAVNVMHAEITGAFTPDQAAADDLALRVAQAFSETTLATQLASTVTLDRLTLRDLRTPNQPEFVAPVAGTGGSIGGTLLPGQVALNVTLRTALVGRSFRGRVYIPGFGEAANEAGGVASAVAVSQTQDFIVRWRAQLPAVGLQLGVVSRVSGGVEREPAIITPVTLVQTRDNRWDTQRRRAVPGI